MKRPGTSKATAAVPSGPVVLDSSAILAFLRRETGGEVVKALLTGGRVSAVNYAEVAGKLIDLGMPVNAATSLLDGLEIRIADFGRPEAGLTSALRGSSRHLGLSLGDRACLALGLLENATVLTADRAWAELKVDGLAVYLIR